MVTRGTIMGSKKFMSISICSVILLFLGSSIIAFLIVKGTSNEDQEAPLKAVIEVDKLIAYVDETIEFYGSDASTGEIKGYVWDFGNEIIEEGSNITKSFDRSRHYNVYLIVTDVDGENRILP